MKNLSFLLIAAGLSISTLTYAHTSTESLHSTIQTQIQGENSGSTEKYARKDKNSSLNGKFSSSTYDQSAGTHAPGSYDFVNNRLYEEETDSVVTVHPQY